MNDDPYVSKTKPILAYSALGIGGLCLILLFFVDIPSQNKDMVNFFLGAICGVITTVFGFYFGDSEQRKKKDEKTNE